MASIEPGWDIDTPGPIEERIKEKWRASMKYLMDDRGFPTFDIEDLVFDEDKIYMITPNQAELTEKHHEEIKEVFKIKILHFLMIIIDLQKNLFIDLLSVY
jgi:hypothetical protein